MHATGRSVKLTFGQWSGDKEYEENKLDIEKDHLGVINTNILIKTIQKYARNFILLNADKYNWTEENFVLFWLLQIHAFSTKQITKKYIIL